MNQTKENQQAEKKEPLTAKDKPLTGTDQEKSALEKAIETIAGDNKLMGTALKILLSPITLLVGAGLFIYCFYKMKDQKEEIEKLKTENKKLMDEKTELQEDYDKVKKKFKKLKNLNEMEAEKSITGLGFIPRQLQGVDQAKKKTYQSAYLD